jgi:hypothetical protein
MSGTHRARLVTLAIAGGGVLLGHWLTYLVDVPGAAARAATLRATGHGYLHAAGELVTAFLAISIAAVFLGALVDRGGRLRTARSPVARLATLQVGAFVGMEAVERLVSGAPLGDLMHSGILPVGVVANVAIAVVGAWLLRRILALGDHLAESSLGSGPPLAHGRGGVSILPAVRAARPRRPALAALPVRGPPLPTCR